MTPQPGVVEPIPLMKRILVCVVCVIVHHFTAVSGKIVLTALLEYLMQVTVLLVVLIVCCKEALFPEIQPVY